MEKTQKWHQFALLPRPGANLRNVWHSFPRGRHPPPTFPQQTNPQIGYWQVALFIAPALSFFAVAALHSWPLFIFVLKNENAQPPAIATCVPLDAIPAREGRSRVAICAPISLQSCARLLWWIAVRKSVVNFLPILWPMNADFFGGLRADQVRVSYLEKNREREKKLVRIGQQNRKSQQK